MAGRVKLRGICKGNAWVEVDGEMVGAVARTDAGTWWASVGEKDRYGGYVFEVIDEFWLRREAVACLVARHDKGATDALHP